MSKILALDSSTEACSCALNIDGEVVEQYKVIPRQHAVQLLPMIEALMSQHQLKFTDLDAIAVARGPGSFTGLRIAAGAAQGIAFGADIPVIPVSTLEALAFQAHQNSQENNILSCLDARINEVYWAVYQFDSGSLLPKALVSESLSKPELIDADLNQRFYGAGNGMAFLGTMPESIQKRIYKFDTALLPHAADIATLASFHFEAGSEIPPESLIPLYLRDKVTHN